MIDDDQQAILFAKTEYREAYKSADIGRLLAVFAAEFTDCSDGEPSFYGAEARRALQIRTAELSRTHNIDMVVIIIDIVVKDDLAYDWGWHKVRLTDKKTGDVTDCKYRYFETWRRDNGAWKIDYIITNKELPPRMLPDEQNPTAQPTLAVKTT